MLFFGTKKDGNYFLAQKLFGILAESAPADLKEKIVLQKDLMRKAKPDDEYSLLFSYKRHNGREPFFETGGVFFVDLPFASIRLRQDDGGEFFADFFFDSKGLIFAVTFSKFPKDDRFEAVGADFYPDIMDWAKSGEKDDISKEPFRISDRLVSILGKEYDREYAPYREDADSRIAPDFDCEPAPMDRIRQDWARFVHADMPEDWKEFTRYFSFLEWGKGVTVFGYGRNLNQVLLDDGTAMYLIASICNDDSSCLESYVLAAADPSKQGTLYFMPDHDVGAAGLIPIGNDLFGFLRKTNDPKFLKSLGGQSYPR